MFETIKKYYNSGVWNEKKVRHAVEKNMITKEQFKAITGKNY